MVGSFSWHYTSDVGEYANALNLVIIQESIKNMNYKNTQEKTAQALWGLIIAMILLFVFFTGLGYLVFNGVEVEGEDLVANQ